jgi:hypothetical protein
MRLRDKLKLRFADSFIEEKYLNTLVFMLPGRFYVVGF